MPNEEKELLAAFRELSAPMREVFLERVVSARNGERERAIAWGEEFKREINAALAEVRGEAAQRRRSRVRLAWTGPVK